MASPIIPPRHLVFRVVILSFVWQKPRTCCLKSWEFTNPIPYQSVPWAPPEPPDKTNEEPLDSYTWDLHFLAFCKQQMSISNRDM